ncbi:ClpXP protease specificity-enhancing factor [Shewanella sedimentimangrovi]|uniref:ClpXP protease specificity-enhancing factor n=1 Tax=Shewanella sedimentimangrovi TaxID=2814293 RepID=A0ABX7R188_9GAMM|nr:ClpXP protease specificity-enhancing factor [Shewanella sedimentimangrovi]QSX36635.1 ClpXP protease specificity-enhancing factor [Shewanella sedimentimangrovi]
MKPLSPSRPYLLRAYYDWLMDNQLTPHVVVDAFFKGTQVPQQYVKDGQIVLNIAAGAVGNLQIGNDAVEFNARFGGVPQHVVLPMGSIVAIYARENGAGTVFDAEDAYLLDEDEAALLDVVDSQKPDPDSEPPKPESKRRGHLTLVK